MCLLDEALSAPRTERPTRGASAKRAAEVEMSNAVQAGPPEGLTNQEAGERLRKWGPNETPEERANAVLLALRKFWGPVPWMLELTLALELASGKIVEAVIIVGLLFLNATVSFVQESRARGALALLRQRLEVQARVRRDGCWQLVPARDLVPDDVVHVRVGDFVPADLLVLDGGVLLDQSALTGESAPVETGPGNPACAGAVVRRGEATGRVTATGGRTSFGKTAELVRTAHAPSRQEAVIFTIVKYLVAFDVVLLVVLLAYAWFSNLPWAEVLPYALILLVASVPVALPATYTLATALGALELAKRGVLATRLAAVEEASAMDVLCSDKTGTITENRLTLAVLRAYPPFSERDVLRLAALACDESTQDPIDLALLGPARDQGLLADRPPLLQFLPFDPATKRSEVRLRDGDETLHVIKGAPAVVAGLVAEGADWNGDVRELAAKGFRILAVAAGPEGRLRRAGLAALHDPPRPESAAMVRRLKDLGVRTVMVTGDGEDTARAAAAAVGIDGRVCPADALREGMGADVLEYGVFAGVLPQDKFRLIDALQRAGHVVGMTGDGVNDAPALKQAEVGIAVANATDVAKAAASLVLTRPGLADAPQAVETGRRIYQRLLTYTLNKIVKTFQIALFLTAGLIATGVFVTTPRLVLLLLFANDFVTMSLASDRASFSRKPDRWPVRALVVAALALACGWLVLSFAVFFVGRDALGLDLPRLQTLIFLLLVFTGQANVYLVRERGRFWRSVPGRWLLVFSVADVIAVSVLASEGFLMAAVPVVLILELLAAVGAYTILLDFLKVWLFRALDIA